MNHEQGHNQKDIAGGNRGSGSQRRNGFRPATTDTGQLASCVQGHMQRYHALQRRLHLRNPHWNNRRMCQGPRATQAAQKIDVMEECSHRLAL
jgi:hypothetical protein